MNVLVDTNVLLRLADQNHAMHATAAHAVEVFRRTKTLCIFPQNLYEFWVVATRPLKDNGLGYSQDEALTTIDSLENFYRLLPETTEFFLHWRSLLGEITVHGKVGHDAHLVAGMKASGVTEVLTFNDRDFVRFTGITVVNPKNLLAG